MLLRFLPLLLAVGFVHPAQAATPGSAHAAHHRHRELQEAMGVAEAETGGEAVTARRVAMNGTAAPDGLGGIEVLVHMPNAKQGWRCLIDSNNMKLRSKERTHNPPSKVR
jgi:hypothetical protein